MVQNNKRGNKYNNRKTEEISRETKTLSTVYVSLENNGKTEEKKRRKWCKYNERKIEKNQYEDKNQMDKINSIKGVL